jgi:hypothetical protein
MPKTRIMYIEDKSASLNGPARIGRVMFSGESISYGGRTFQSLKDSGFKANYSTLTPEKDFGFQVREKMAKIASTLEAPRQSKSTLTSRRNTGVALGESAPNKFHERRPANRSSTSLTRSCDTRR